MFKFPVSTWLMETRPIALPPAMSGTPSQLRTASKPRRCDQPGKVLVSATKRLRWRSITWRNAGADRVR